MIFNSSVVKYALNREERHKGPFIAWTLLVQT